MKIADILMRIEIVNNENLYIVDLDRVAKFTIEDEVDGVKLGGSDIIRLINIMIEFTRIHNNFLLAMYKCYIGQTRIIWRFCVLYRTDDNWQRVHIERVACENCEWKGLIANPTLPSLYDTVKNKHDALDIAWNLPRKKCPSCGKELSRYAIWIE